MEICWATCFSRTRADDWKSKVVPFMEKYFAFTGLFFRNICSLYGRSYWRSTTLHIVCSRLSYQETLCFLRQTLQTWDEGGFAQLFCSAKLSHHQGNLFHLSDFPRQTLVLSQSFWSTRLFLSNWLFLSRFKLIFFSDKKLKTNKTVTIDWEQHHVVCVSFTCASFLGTNGFTSFLIWNKKWKLLFRLCDFVFWFILMWTIFPFKVFRVSYSVKWI